MPLATPAVPQRLGLKRQFPGQLEEFSSWQRKIYLDADGFLDRADGPLRRGRDIVMGFCDSPGAPETLWRIPDKSAADRICFDLRKEVGEPNWQPPTWYWLEKAG